MKTLATGRQQAEAIGRWLISLKGRHITKSRLLTKGSTETACQNIRFSGSGLHFEFGLDLGVRILHRSQSILQERACAPDNA